jgi:hypothetical protein
MEPEARMVTSWATILRAASSAFTSSYWGLRPAERLEQHRVAGALQGLQEVVNHLLIGHRGTGPASIGGSLPGRAAIRANAGKLVGRYAEAGWHDPLVGSGGG